MEQRGREAGGGGPGFLPRAGRPHAGQILSSRSRMTLGAPFCSFMKQGSGLSRPDRHGLSLPHCSPCSLHDPRQGPNVPPDHPNMVMDAWLSCFRNRNQSRHSTWQIEPRVYFLCIFISIFIALM